jgi:hypothetical protein
VTTNLSPQLDRLIEAAMAGLDAAAGGGAVCAFTKAGTPVPGIKHHEGRWAALNEVARRCRRDPQDPATAALQISEDWSADLERLTQRDAGPDWIAYRTGGLDALGDLVAAAAPTAHP